VCRSFRRFCCLSALYSFPLETPNSFARIQPAAQTRPFVRATRAAQTNRDDAIQAHQTTQQEERRVQPETQNLRAMHTNRTNLSDGLAHAAAVASSLVVKHRACSRCHRAKTACGGQQPCGRCVRLGETVAANCTVHKLKHELQAEQLATKQRARAGINTTAPTRAPQVEHVDGDQVGHYPSSQPPPPASPLDVVQQYNLKQQSLHQQHQLSHQQTMENIRQMQVEREQLTIRHTEQQQVQYHPSSAPAASPQHVPAHPPFQPHAMQFAPQPAQIHPSLQLDTSLPSAGRLGLPLGYSPRDEPATAFQHPLSHLTPAGSGLSNLSISVSASGDLGPISSSIFAPTHPDRRSCISGGVSVDVETFQHRAHLQVGMSFASEVFKTATPRSAQMRSPRSGQRGISDGLIGFASAQVFTPAGFNEQTGQIKPVPSFLSSLPPTSPRKSIAQEQASQTNLAYSVPLVTPCLTAAAVVCASPSGASYPAAASIVVPQGGPEQRG
jgi:hypothetical protein